MSSKCYRRRAAVFLCLALFSFANQQTREDALAVGTAVAAVPLCAMPPVSAVGGLNAFGLGLFKLLSKKDAENVLISPMSLSVCLSMVAAGSTPDSTTEKEFLSVLGGHMASLPKTSAQMANSAWVRSAIKPEYIEAIKKDFEAEALPLTDPDPAPINKWVSERTSGLIPELFSGPLDPLTVLVLVNTIFFKGSWATVFDSANTKSGEFRGFASKMPCDMMWKKEKKLGYTDMPGYQAVQLPYSDKSTFATVILPKEEGPAGLEKLVEDFDWKQLLGFMEPSEVELRLPRFKVSAGGSMSDALKALGIKEAFESKNGFLRMSDDPLVYLNDVVHKATVLVNEEGTVAAAATGAVMATRCLPPPAMKVTVDRPFLFVISDADGSLLFIGKVVVPELTGIDASLKGGYKA
ncbi:unnamed protein product [Durusdinium trenchii]|uniref:Serpin domain-containing protein n=2 Tax=Durusdinium trenchii TaxID=1381693 RepID=A0ABP0NAP4_9DINO